MLQRFLGIISVVSVLVLGLSTGIFFDVSAQAQTATLTLVPSTTNPAIDQQFTIGIQLSTGGQAASGLDINKLHFDTTLFEVVSVSQTASALAPITGSLNFNNTAGTLGFSQIVSPIGQTFSGNTTVATVTIRAKASGTGSFSFDFAPGATTDTNVAGQSGVDILQSANSVSITVAGNTPPPSVSATARLRLVGPQSVNVGQSFDVQIKLDANQNQVSGVDINKLRFDRSIFEVVSITPGTALGQVVANQYDNTAGTVTYSQIAPFGQTFSGNDATIATIRFRAKAVNTQGSALLFDFNLGATNDTNVAYNGADVLASVANTSIVVSSTGGGSQNSAVLRAVAPSSVLMNDTFDVVLKLDTNQNQTSGVDINSLHFNNSVLEVVSVTPGTALSQVVTNTYSNTAGTVTYSQIAPFGQTFSGNDATIATIRFRAKQSGTSQLNFDFTQGATNDTNVAYNGTDVLASVTNDSVTVTGGSGGSQNSAVLRIDAPATVAVNNTFAARIILDTNQNQTSGVDISSLRFNTSVLEVVSVTPGTALSQVVTNTYSNTAGTVTYSQIAPFGQTFSGNDAVVATVNFRAKQAGSSQLNFDFTQGATNDTNVAYNGTDVLASVTNDSVTVTGGSGGSQNSAVLRVVAPGIVQVNDTFDVVIKLDTNQSQTSGVDINSFRFNSSLLEVVSITPGSALSQVVTNTYSNTAGTVTYSQIAPFGQTFSGNDATMATIRFRAKQSGTSQLNFDFTQGATNDTNVAYNGTDVLASVTNDSVLINAGSGGGINQTAAIRLSGNSSVSANDTFVVNVILDTNQNQASGVDINQLHFDSNVLEVVSVAPGTALGQVVANQYDNTAGTVTYSQIAPFGQTFSGNNATIAAITFRAKQAGSSQLWFDFTLGNTSDTNVAYNGDDVLGSTSGLNVVVSGTGGGGNTSATATLAIAGPSQVNNEQLFSIEVILNTNQNQTSGVDIKTLHFDPSKVEVVQVFAGSALDQVIVNQYDNTAGTVTYSQIAPFGQNFSGNNAQVMTIQFRSKQLGTALFYLDFTAGATNDTNVAYNGNDVLASVTGLSTMISGQSATNAVLRLQAPAQSALNSEFDVVVKLDTNQSVTSGVDLNKVRFNPSLLEVISVTPGNALDQVVVNQHDNSAGTVTYTQIASFGQTFSGNDATIATIRMRAKQAGTANISLDFNPGSTTDTNVANNGADVLSAVQNASVTIGGQATGSAHLSVNAPAVVTEGQSFEATILLTTNQHQISGVDINALRFNPSILEVVSITPGTALDQVVVNTYNNTAGTVTYSQIAPFGQTFSGNNAVIATITFRALQASSATDLTFDYTPGATNDTNVAASGTDVLGSISNDTLAVIANSGGGGNQVPEIVLVATANKNQAYPGDTIEYALVYQNTSSVVAQNVVLKDQLDPNVTYVSGGTYDPFTHTVTWNIGTLAAGQQGTVTLAVVTIVPTASCGDGELAPNEECDDGNVINGDGCTATCMLEQSPCVTGSYQEIDDTSRNVLHTGIPYFCDQGIAEDTWIRFTGASGTHIPTSPPPRYSCGAHAPGWLSGTEPQASDGIVNRRVCFSWKDENNTPDTCYWATDIEVLSCGDYMLYRLQEPPVCKLRYCSAN